MDQHFKQILQKHHLSLADHHVLLAISGGVDSIVLFHLLLNLPKEKRPRISVAHVNHQLRPGADQEEDFVRALATRYGFPFYSFRWDKQAHPKTGIEEAARNVRYRFFKEIMQKHSISILMTAHHQDDQVETILMKLTRGSTLLQLTGIPFTQPFPGGKLVRPLLAFSKQELYAFAKEQQLDYREDETNFELLYARNRFRNEIIPLLQQENSQFNQHILQFAADLNDLLAVSKEAVAEKFQEVTNQNKNGIWLNSAKFGELSEAYQRLVLKKTLDTVYQSEEQFYKKNYVDLIQDWIFNGLVNTKLNLQSGVIAEKEYDKINFSKKKKQVQKTKKTQYSLQNVGQWVWLSETERIGLFIVEEAEAKVLQDSEHVLIIGADFLHLPLTIRHRKPGDRMQYAGLNGSKKIKDIFIDEKTAPIKRDQAWIVEDNRGIILWLVSYRKMNLYPDEETDKLTYVLKYKKD